MDSSSDKTTHPEYSPEMLKSLYAISRSGRESQNTDEIISIIINTVSAHFDSTSATITLINPDTKRLEIEISKGLPESEDSSTLEFTKGVIGWVALHNRSLLIPDMDHDSRYMPGKENIACTMIVPMDDNGHVIGVLNLNKDQADTFTQENLKELEQLTQEATNILQQRWLFDHLRQKSEQLEVFTKVGQSLVSKLEIQELIESVSKECQAITQCRLCTIQFYDSQNKTVQLKAHYPSSKGLKRTETPLIESLAGSSIRTRKQIEIVDLQNPGFIDLEDIPPDSQIRSVLSTPMIVEGEVLGAINIFTGHIHRFANDERRLLNALATMSAIAVQNTRLYTRVFKSEENLRRNEKLTTLGLLSAEIAHEIRNPLTVLNLLFGSLDLTFPQDDPRNTDTAVIKEKLDQLEAIVGRVLSFSKAPQSLYAHWDIDELINETILLIRLKLHQSKIKLHHKKTSHPSIVACNKGQIQQVPLNLLINSMDAMPDGGEIQIRSSLKQESGRNLLMIDIEDSGTGIPEEIQPN
ncbi:MAG: GAF domain-containing protein, partial [Opitutaceae bacterium]|nr:GAF domain-containing protein [Opitutaceae bacterium]